MSLHNSQTAFVIHLSTTLSHMPGTDFNSLKEVTNNKTIKFFWKNMNTINVCYHDLTIILHKSSLSNHLLN